jgi:O-antigen ligase
MCAALARHHSSRRLPLDKKPGASRALSFGELTCPDVGEVQFWVSSFIASATVRRVPQETDMPNLTTLRAALTWLAVETWLAISTWRGPDAARARGARQRAADIVLVVLAGTLPWSTAGSAGLIIAALAFILMTINAAGFFAALRHGAWGLPLALFALAVLGTSWAVDVPWPDRFHGIDQIAKLWFLPLLFTHFQESPRGKWIFAAFVASNVVLLGFSFVVFVAPHLAITPKLDQPGVPVKNYIDQSQAFTLCAVGLTGLAIEALMLRKYFWAAVAAAIAATFFANLAFINVARTAFVYLPVMLLLLMYRYLSGRRFAAALAAAGVVAVGLWATSPNLQHKVSRIYSEYDQFGAPVGEDGPVSVAMRLEYWRKSLTFVRAAPLWGHGTGATRQLFQRDAEGQTGLGALVTANPHNQTLAVAIQWGLVGCILLYAMWISHLLLFRGRDFVAFVGLLVVAQNIASSLFNSHLFDFYEGWLYVIAVGIAGGMVRHRDAARTPAS